MQKKSTTLSFPVIWQRHFKRLLVCRQEYDTPAMQHLFAHLDEYIDHRSTQFFKNTPGDTSTVALVKIDQAEFVIKRYNIKNWRHRLKLGLRPSRAMTSWKNAHRLLALNIPTATPIAVIEDRLGPWRGKAYFIAQYMAGMSASDYFARFHQDPQRCEQVLTDMAKIVQQLRVAKISHADFHHKNLLVIDDKPVLLDLDHMRQHRFTRFTFNKSHQADIAQFIQYLSVYPGVVDVFLAALKKIAENNIV